MINNKLMMRWTETFARRYIVNMVKIVNDIVLTVNVPEGVSSSVRKVT